MYNLFQKHSVLAKTQYGFQNNMNHMSRYFRCSNQYLWSN